MNGAQQIRFNVAAFVFDHDGAVVTRLGTTVSFDVKPGKLDAMKALSYPFDQRINLARGDNYLYLAIWDAHSGRLGTLQIPFKVGKPK